MARRDEGCICCITSGGVIEADEAQAILDFLSQQDPNGWCSLIGWETRGIDRPFFATCVVKPNGEVGVTLNLNGLFDDRAAAERANESLIVRGAQIKILPPVSLQAFWGNRDADSTSSVSGAKWERIQAGQSFTGHSVSFYEGEVTAVRWRFLGKSVSFEDEGGASYVIDLPISELSVEIVR